MNQKNPNPYANYGFTGQQGQTPYYGNAQQGGQQPMYQQMPPMQQMPPQQMQIPQQMQAPSGTSYQGGPLEASGGLLVPVTPTTQNKNQNVAANVPGMLSIDQAYIENLLRINKGRLATVYMTFNNNPEWGAKVFKGLIESAGRDHLLLSDPQTGTQSLLLLVNLDYITFDEPIEHDSSFGGYSTYSPR